MKARLCAILVAVFSCAASAAEVGLYLYPKAERGNAPLTISDIAQVETDGETASRVGAVGIDDALYADGYLDSKEISDCIREHAGGRITVYGSGVRIVRTAGVTLAAEAPRRIVRAGSPVRFQVVNARITVERAGTAMQDGAAGDMIPVKLKGATVVRGVILNERTVELKL